MNTILRAALAAALLAPAAARAQAAAYFQQGVSYRIEARMDEDSHVLHGRARLTYTNHSPATLDSIYLHQHLNAFRPNSAWATRELQFGNRRFQDLGPDDYAYERFTALSVAGRPAHAVYPLSPDSTVAAVALATPLRPGETVVLDMDWDARVATTFRRQGRAGRHYDFAQWYPRIAVYDRGGWEAHPLLPQGEFYGEYASYDVTLEVAADQVIGSTGVAVFGDPGYPVSDYEKRFYRRGGAVPLGLITGSTPEGRKWVRFHAEDVHHFAWSMDPAYRHDGVTRVEMNDTPEGIRGLPVIHVLYLPADSATWGRNQASRFTYDALSWLGAIMSPYPWPQLTNLHRLDSGGTEFPMMIMDGGASESLIVHETGHQWVHGILGNNEWKQGWLDEGFSSFLTNWYFEEKNARAGNDTADVWRNTMAGLERLEKTDSTQAVALRGEDYLNPRIYTAMTYSKGSVVLRMLRYQLGDEVMRRVLHEYARRFQFHHVTSDDLRAVAEEVSGQQLGWFWDQWINRTDHLDYAVTSARTRRTRDGRWQTRVMLERRGDAWMPVDLRAAETTQRVSNRSRRLAVTLLSATRPTEVLADPRWILLDSDRSNNRLAVP